MLFMYIVIIKTLLLYYSIEIQAIRRTWQEGATLSETKTTISDNVNYFTIYGGILSDKK